MQLAAIPGELYQAVSRLSTKSGLVGDNNEGMKK